jgi:hypothetical protein
VYPWGVIVPPWRLYSLGVIVPPWRLYSLGFIVSIRSLTSALVLADLQPIWMNPDIDEATGVPTGIGAAQLEQVDYYPIMNYLFSGV